MNSLSQFLSGAVFSAVAVSTLAQPAVAEFAAVGDPKPAVILYGPTNDGGWSQSIDEARVKLEGGLGLRIPQAAEIPESATAIRPAAELFIDRGANIVIGSAFGYSDTFKELAEEYPDVIFINPAGITNSDNLKSVYGRTYESQYLCGMVAGGLAENGKLGFVAANPFPLVNWTINAYLMGARAVNPDAELTVVFTGTWGDPVKERAATEALLEQGVEVVGQHVDTATPQIVAAEAGIYGTGHHRDLSEFSEATQCSSVWTWEKFLEPEITKASAGEWEPAPYGAFLGIAEGGTDVSVTGDAVSEDLKAEVMEARDAIMSGELQIFAGPLSDRSGEMRVPDGEVLSDADLWAMDWFVQGVTGGE
ncbi:BMP family ABC transporter substrate-binding protein [Maritimibacter sp. UBA3975]|uniref:BMP family ABC transporter substrate-binding protein n=1 Tax=Maritimibacter sp. UBA3975 TaxID=1946833 RepID=UPI000C090D9B|nr:BMP family ABC transporter substrate-binding protein [Maritimibacter sp. UBA3975]MAM60278.1 BMP family ABC transporter substrate-binding protein [Maritimibacter sp.]|tara:strand:+ start:6552 stop:7643 length:1092 start_codon:yes stop_codon:yes gene_type:complete